MKELFIKYIKRECTEDEVQQIIAYFQNSADFSDVPTIEAVSQWLDAYPDMEEASANRIRKNILETGKVEALPSKKKSQFWKYAAAAIFVIALSSTYFLRNILFNPKIENTTPIVVNNQIKPGIDKATLTLENGENITLEKGGQFQTQNATSNGEEISYIKSTSQELVYNYLTIPRGGQFQMTLSDSTKVWLNSETQLKYPVRFKDGETRRVELVYGEAYFEVSPSTEHQGANFKVWNNKQEIEVLGTKFNVKAYKNEANIYTTLVEGKVALATAKAKRILAPGEQSNVSVESNRIAITKVDVYNQISWKEGVFSFESMELSEVMKVLARWYDMKVSIENKTIEQLRFTGGIRKNQGIESILSVICNNITNVSFEIHDKKVFLKAY